jgi:chemotaxis protein MotC
MRRAAAGPCLAVRLRIVVAGLVFQFAPVPAGCGETPSQDRMRAPSETRNAQPFELVRSLESVQDQIVLGNADAQAKLPKLLGRIATGILAAEPRAWEDPRNLRAVIVYASSGGQARVVRAVAELGVARGETKDLLDGVLAYVEGQDERAKQILLPIEAMSLPAPLAGHVALVQSNLIAREDPRKAMQLLARARVLAPGTLVEEAALRKEIFLADQADDLDSFASLSSQYIRRFDRSAYSENFRQRFRAGIMHFALTSDPARFAKLEAVLAVLEPEEALRLLLATAQAGLLAGMVEPARHAVEKAAASAKKGTAEASRATLYAAAIRVLTGEIDAGLVGLQGLESSKLSKSDAELANVVQKLASDIQAQPSQERQIGAEPQPVEEKPPESREGRATASAAALIRRTETVLDDVEALLDRRGF